MIVRAESDAQILATCDVMRQLRPHLPEGAEYVSAIRAIGASDGYRLACLDDGREVRAVAGYRVLTMLYCGRALSVDDFVTDEQARSRGHGARRLEWLMAKASALGCAELQLISHTTRDSAHRFYFREGLGITAFHFGTVLS